MINGWINGVHLCGVKYEYFVDALSGIYFMFQWMSV